MSVGVIELFHIKPVKSQFISRGVWMWWKLKSGMTGLAARGDQSMRDDRNLDRKNGRMSE